MEQTDIYNRISLAKEGNTEARDRIVTENLGLVWSIVKKFLNRGHEAEDLFQIGSIGLLKAIERFDTNYGVKFSTYAVPIIMGEIKRHIRDDGIIKVSRSLKETAIKAKGAMDFLAKDLCREPTISEIAMAVNVPEEEIVMALDAVAAPESINQTFGEEGGETLDLIDNGGNMEQELINKIAIKEALQYLSPRERKIIILRYFKDKTQSQVASQLGISQVQVSRIEKKVLLQMRDKMTG